MNRERDRSTLQYITVFRMGAQAVKAQQHSYRVALIKHTYNPNN